MFKKLLNNKKGFTLIEIVLVLAIAGLIMVIVFLAVSGAQKARRDNARKAFLNRYAAAVEQSAGNNSGKVPDNGTAVGTSYIDLTTASPLGATYVVASTTADTDAKIRYRSNSVANTFCDGTSMTTASAGNARQYAVSIYLEQGGADAYCVDNK